jgi:hypothetical protein
MVRYDGLHYQGEDNERDQPQEHATRIDRLGIGRDLAHTQATLYYLGDSLTTLHG